jgi:SAM-dependent methyltransferase
MTEPAARHPRPDHTLSIPLAAVPAGLKGSCSSCDRPRPTPLSERWTPSSDDSHRSSRFHIQEVNFTLTMTGRRPKDYQACPWQGMVARWDASLRGSESQGTAWRRQAARLTEILPGVAHLPFPDGPFDLIVSQAAFKNFARPQRAIDEMYRVLCDGGTAMIQDRRRDAPDATVDEEVRGMGLGPVSAFLTRWTLRGLRRRAYTAAQFEPSPPPAPSAPARS